MCVDTLLLSWYNSVMQSVRLRSYAKVNLSLSVTGTRGDRHTLDSVVTSISVYNEIIAERTDEKGVFVNFESGKIANNALLAATLASQTFGVDGIKVVIKEGIPCGGVGGSSADAAGVLRAIAELFPAAMDDVAMRDIALQVGSDVPYMLCGGFARLGGIGESVEYFSAPNRELLFVPLESVNTAECFAAFDRLSTRSFSDESAFTDALKRGDDILPYLHNDLCDAAVSLMPKIGDVLDRLNSAGLKAIVTGSGGNVIAFGSHDGLLRAQKIVDGARIVETRGEGIEILRRA